MKKVGFFGGTFDPIHFGHLNLAIEILEKCALEHVFFCPANFSPEKQTNQPEIPPIARKEMVELAIKEVPEFSLITIELEREGPSYTIDTIQALIGEYPDTQFHLILGEDILKGLPQWKEVETLLQLAPPLIGTRPHNHEIELPSNILSLIEKGEIPISRMEISATILRERLTQKKYCGHLIPSEVLDYIITNQLY